VKPTDPLQRAARALRTSHTGERAGSGFTRAGIMKTLHARRRRRTLGWATLGPSLALLLGTSAWAQATGQWPRVWHEVIGVFSIVARDDGVAPAETAAPEPSSPGVSTQPSTSSTSPEPASSSAVPESAPDNATAAMGDEPLPSAPRPRHSADQRAPTPRSSRPPTPAPPHEAEPPAPRTAVAQAAPTPPRDAELVRFRAAHDTHYRASDPLAAILAYRDYLAAYPQGRFVPEARYNIALNLLRLGRHGEARQQLEPFARGDYGDYRRQAATRLLRSLPGKSQSR
jgi:TolA-binding protein